MKYIWDGKHWALRGHKRVSTAPAVLGDYHAYDCPITGKPVEGRLAHRENLERHGCRQYERGETQERVANHQRDSDAHIERIADRMAETMQEIA